MREKLTKVFSYIVNVNQFFRYGRVWLQIGIDFLAFTAYISILIIYFSLPQTPELLGALTFLAIAFLIGMGALLFFFRGQQRDRIMDSWRNPLSYLLTVCWVSGLLEFYKREQIPIPEGLRSWGVENWDDASRIVDYILKVGEDAYAKQICKNFLENKNDFSNS